MTLDAVDFGAKGDGAANDAPAIQTALDAAGATGCGTVFLSPGTFLVGNSLSIPSNVTLQGAGSGATILRDHAALGASRLIFLQGKAATRLRNVRVAGMTLHGCAATGSYTIGKDALRAEYVDGLLVEGRSH